jgi:hypothetical protein
VGVVPSKIAAVDLDLAGFDVVGAVGAGIGDGEVHGRAADDAGRNGEG